MLKGLKLYAIKHVILITLPNSTHQIRRKKTTFHRIYDLSKLLRNYNWSLATNKKMITFNSTET